MEIRDPSTSAVYALEYLAERTVQLRIFDTSTWTIAPSGAEENVGRKAGAKISDMSFLGLPDTSSAYNASIRKRM